MLFLLLILISYIAYNYLFAYKKILTQTVSNILSDHFWIFDLKGKLISASNDSFIDFDDFIQKFEKCFHVYGQKQEVVQKLIAFESFEIILQKKGNQQFFG